MTGHFTYGPISDLAVGKHRKRVWSYMTPNVLVETRCISNSMKPRTIEVLNETQNPNSKEYVCQFKHILLFRTKGSGMAKCDI